ncbi:MAG: NADH-quinone oxidoreductase subunit N [Chloroflexi bacterium]|jgi:NADH-quinone oxidoreductase subunit N|uniref:NADH-quinone oxidoreductase subunit N n=1 Tax=Candidatus Thermofonsia Clade 3 bacterium TaxID=2364212 RepID=A0A2M8QDU6_9CHLR|nr:NADH-quinone oxidoreductase subunit N [Candidatus Roseilinea sp. NK_OTU-006]PJF47976.1 MAG: NADH-quinone oxidoreductase subunit N [Candidatus Thermofonsia Clade 3 bacterium]RMG65297.1 MAG: NADH-quinone oxidoreductase subunit N [Chloroflexota bacterium]
MPANDLIAVLPFLIVAVGGIALLLIDLALPAEQKSVTAWLSAGTLGVAGLAALLLMGVAPFDAFQAMVRADGYAFFLDALIAAIGFLAVLMALRYNEARGIMRGEFYALMLFSIGGMMLMGHAVNLLMVFVAVELLSIPLYTLCGIARPRLESEESAMKYFLMGAFASGFLVYGIALVYGAAGTTSLPALSAILSAEGARPAYDPALLFAGAALILVGLGFKVAAAPFHMWTPDVYEGAPTTVTAFMATATKAAGFAAVLRVFMFGFQPLLPEWQPIVALIAALTMIVGNVAALAQHNVKRMLAYSSIAHAGYALAGVAAGSEAGAASVLFYLAAYAFTTLAAFAVMTAMGSGAEENQTFDAYAGLGRSRPALGIGMAVAMFSLIGIPPTAGFVGKYFLFGAAVAAGLTWLAVIGVLTSVVSSYFYLRLVMTMFMREPQAEGEPIPPHAPRSLAAAISVAAVFIFGLLPAPLLGMITAGVQSAIR